MFHFNKRKEVMISKDQLEKLKEEQEIYYQKLAQDLKSKQKEMYESWSSHLEELLQNQQKKQNNLSDAVEDLLDEWNERNQLAEEYQEQLSTEKQRSQQFLSLIQLLFVQNQLLQTEISKTYNDNSETSHAWKQQLDLFRQQIQNSMLQCELQWIGEEGELVDGSCHQVLDVIETTDPEQHSHIAKIHERGLMYRGDVIKKATVTAYK